MSRIAYWMRPRNPSPSSPPMPDDLTRAGTIQYNRYVNMSSDRCKGGWTRQTNVHNYLGHVTLTGLSALISALRFAE